WWHAADLLIPGAAEKLIKAVRPELLLHLAWCTEPGTYWESPENARWLEASCALMRAFAACGGHRAVATGTCAEYDWAHAGAALSEELTPLAPRGRYGEAKDALRREVDRLSASAALSAAWARLFFLFGPGEHPSRLVPSVTRAVLEGRPAPCTEGGQVRDYLASGPAGRALAALLESSVRGPVNVASGRGTSVRKLVELIAGAAGRPDLPRFGAVPSRPGEPARIVADVTRLEQEVGWQAPTNLTEEVEATVEWWRGVGRV
ncbi:MAG: NAD(P)-dependent oxidoreductase, partial [Actinomycetota bacterium]|nr:NAD(P)-dependent oxidoreductase [Actinomycetota bacterium]